MTPAVKSAPVRVSVADAISVIHKKNGTLTPELVVKAAKNPASPLHSCFEWDDSEAGVKYRLEQARALIRSVEVRFTYNKQEISVVKYVRDPNVEPEEQGYVTVESLRGDAESARSALVYECDRVDAGLSRARNIAIGLGLAEKVDAIKLGLNELRKLAS